MSDVAAGTTAAHAHPDRAALVVGLGASAGGIHTLKQFFARVTPGSGLAYVVILHLSPDYDSQLAGVLQAASPIPVTQVTERVRIEPDRVYVVPPNKNLSVADDHIVVSDMAGRDERRAPIDFFFRALADARGSHSAAIVLSGTGPDGSAGIKRVKEYGGLTIAQDPNEAEYSDMPRNSIATGLIDVVLPVAEMPARIATYREHLQRDQERDKAADPSAADPEATREILTLLRVRTGHDFSDYKPATLQRRIQRRMYVRSLPSLASYRRLLREQPDEAIALMKELLISVTTFFRDAAAFDALAARVVPRMFEARAGQEQVRVWVAGCATGEEAYSLAILMAEYAAKAPEHPAIQVFATDLDERAIAKAREGLYTQAEVADLSEERLKRFFHREPGGYRVQRDLRETVLFAHHNVIKDPPFSHIDLVACRNLLIYLNRSVQGRLIETFHFALRPGGYLFVGASESAEARSDLFLLADKDAHVYQRRIIANRRSTPIAEAPAVIGHPFQQHAEVRGTERFASAEIHHRLLEEYAPPSLVTTEEHQVVHMSERVGRYLRVAPGEPSRDLMKLIRPELRADVLIALHEAGRRRAPVHVRGLAVALDGVEWTVSISVRPVLREGDPARGFFLVVFDEAEPDAAREREVQLAAGSDPTAVQHEEELSRVRDQLRQTVEQYETQVEEARASNEELQAMNEELRSSAEELETSKEELQSVNEELTTVNQELKIKVEELAVANNDLQNLIKSSGVGTIFLDRNLRVKLSTPMARRIFNLVDADSGRPLSDITSHMMYDRLHEDVRHVLHDLRTIDREIETHDGRWHVMRLRPYRTADDRIDGVVMTFQDITDRRSAERQVRQSEERLRLLIDSAIDYAIFTMTPDGTIDSWNSGAQRMFGYTADEIVGNSFERLFTPEDRAAGVSPAELARAGQAGRAVDERFHMRKNGEWFYCAGVTTRLEPTGGLGFAKIARDLTDQRHAAEALKRAHDNLEQSVEDRTRALQREVRDRAAAQEHASDLVRKLVTSQEDERARIARDLHDQIGQQLTALRLALERLADERGSDRQLGRAVALAKNIDSELGFIAWELRPAVLDDLGLAAALPRFVSDWSEHYGVVAEYRGSAFQTGLLPHEAEVAFYRIAQEALNNVAKHAHASRVDVMLESRDGSIVLVVEDDGIGFDPSTIASDGRGIGLVGMRERAALIGASLQIESVPGDGTSIFVRCPNRPNG